MLQQGLEESAPVSVVDRHVASVHQVERSKRHVDDRAFDHLDPVEPAQEARVRVECHDMAGSAHAFAEPARDGARPCTDLEHAAPFERERRAEQRSGRWVEDRLERTQPLELSRTRSVLENVTSFAHGSPTVADLVRELCKARPTILTGLTLDVQCCSIAAEKPHMAPHTKVVRAASRLTEVHSFRFTPLSLEHPEL